MPGESKKVPVDNSRQAILSRLCAQKAQALANNDTKTASLIQKIIELIEKKK